MRGSLSPSQQPVIKNGLGAQEGPGSYGEDLSSAGRSVSVSSGIRDGVLSPSHPVSVRCWAPFPTLWPLYQEHSVEMFRSRAVALRHTFLVLIV